MDHNLWQVRQNINLKPYMPQQGHISWKCFKAGNVLKPSQNETLKSLRINDSILKDPKNKSNIVGHLTCNF